MFAEERKRHRGNASIGHIRPAILAIDLNFHERLPRLFPPPAGLKDAFSDSEVRNQSGET